jgi:DNA repair exonuclease SbcCD ATPase subunit
VASQANAQPINAATEEALQTATTAVPVSSATPAAPAGGGAPIIIGGGMPANVPAVANAGNIEEIDKVTEEYIEQVRTLNEAIQRISQQTEALGHNMQEMETLSRNLTGVNALYEVQLRSAGGQLNAIDQVNEQTQKMAQQIEELNTIYARMIEAMTTNMNRPQI